MLFKFDVLRWLGYVLAEFNFMCLITIIYVGFVRILVFI